MSETNYTSKKLAFNNAEQFKESFYEPSPATLGLVFIGNHIQWTNEDSPNSIADTTYDEKSVWDNMYAAKRITGNDVELVLPRQDWTANSVYREYDDEIAMMDLLTANTEQNLKPIYIMNTERNVYLCLSNNVSSNSTVEPLGKNLSANGNIATADGYLWKYLYNIKPSNKFLSNNWLPAPISTSKLDYDGSSLTPVDGEISHIIVTDGGSGYIDSQIFVYPYISGCTVLSVSNTTNLVVEMGVQGLGFSGETYITNIDTLNNLITLSTPATQPGGGSSNLVSVVTRVEVYGDGTSALAVPVLVNGSIQKITMSNYGRNYLHAHAVIYGTGSNATARVVLPPKFGHGYNAAKQLGASNVMISMRIGEMDSSEGGVISTDTSFRQYGLLRDPYKYGNTSPATAATSNTVISQTTDVSIVTGSSYEINEYVYQGSTINPTFSGYVHAQTGNSVRLTRVTGETTIGSPLKGTITNASGRTVINQINPEFQPYTGDILFVENIVKTQRTDGQAENLRFVIRF